jgi:hypothetical protein
MLLKRKNQNQEGIYRITHSHDESEQKYIEHMKKEKSVDVETVAKNMEKVMNW